MEHKCKKTDLKTVEKCELNAKDIIQAMKCCYTDEDNCLNCPYMNDYNSCVGLSKKALALITSQEQRIKELTAKITKWEEECDLRGDMWCKLNEENKRLTKENEKLSQSLANSKSILANFKDENERLKAENENKCKDCAGCLQWKCDCANIEAYAVNEFAKRLIAEIEQTPNANEYFIKAWKSKIDQIAKEKLEGEK